jgi:hypothetical protein
MNLELRFCRYAARSLLAVFTSLLVLSGCAGPTTVADLTPNAMPPDVALQKMSGSITVRTIVPTHTTKPTYVGMDVDDWIDSKKLKQAIESAIAQNQVFSEVKPGDADYLLEVWVDKVQNVLDISGEGFVFNFTSVWRLTRQNDGKVVVCEFVKGHAGAHAWGSRAYPPAISAATRGMIQKGLVAISDQSQSYLSALSTAGDRAAIAAGQ